MAWRDYALDVEVSYTAPADIAPNTMGSAQGVTQGRAQSGEAAGSAQASQTIGRAQPEFTMGIAQRTKVQ